MRGFPKTTFTFLAVLFAVVLALAAYPVLALAAYPVLAQESSQSARSPDDTSQGKSISGSVVSVDSTNKTIRVKDDKDKNEHTIKVDSSTKIQSAGKNVDLSDIKAGDHIVASVKSEAGQMVASSIEVHKSGQSSTSSTGTTGTTSTTPSTPSERDRRSDTGTTGTTSTTPSTTPSTPSEKDRSSTPYGTTSDRDRVGATTGTTGTTSTTPSTTSDIDRRSDTGTMGTTSSTTRGQRRVDQGTTGTTDDMAATGRVSGATGELPRTATPLPLIGTIGLLMLSAGAIVRKIVG